MFNYQYKETIHALAIFEIMLHILNTAPRENHDCMILKYAIMMSVTKVVHVVTQ